MSQCRIGSTDRGHCACALTVQRFSPTPTEFTESRSMAVRFWRLWAQKNHPKWDFLRREPARSKRPSFLCHQQRFWALDRVWWPADLVRHDIDSFSARSIVEGTRRGRRPAAFPPLLPPPPPLLLIRVTQTPRLFPLSLLLYGLFIPSPLPDAQHSSYPLFACSSADKR